MNTTAKRRDVPRRPLDRMLGDLLMCNPITNARGVLFDLFQNGNGSFAIFRWNKDAIWQRIVRAVGISRNTCSRQSFLCCVYTMGEHGANFNKICSIGWGCVLRCMFTTDKCNYCEQEMLYRVHSDNHLTFAITGSEKRSAEGALLFTVRVDGGVRAHLHCVTMLRH